MNLADVFRLRWKDVDLDAGTTTFIRQKTTTTRKAKQVKITASLFDESRANINRASTSYLFPYLDDAMDARRQKAVIRQLVKITNHYMGRIGQALGIQGEVNTYAARHSFATILLRSEAPVAFISQSLGHTSLKTTEDYLGSFEDEQTKKYLNNLL
jgi:integrase